MNDQMTSLQDVNPRARVKLKPGIQFKTEAKRQHNLTWKKLGKTLGVSKYTVRHSWKNEVNLIPLQELKEIGNLLDLENGEISEHIEEIKSPNWGQVKGGKKSKGKELKKINFPNKSYQLSEFVGIMLGDGNIFSKTYPNTTVNCIRVAGNLKNEKPYLLEFVKPLMETLFKVEASVYRDEEGNELLLAIHGKNMIKFMKKIGVPPGNKVKNEIGIPKWIFGRKSYLRSCTRGLIDTDGTIYALKPHYPNLLQISFKNNNQRLLSDLRVSLQKLGYHPSKISARNVYLSRQKEIERYVRKIRFNNPKNRKRYREAR